jgi:hypothetical protein
MFLVTKLGEFIACVAVYAGVGGTAGYSQAKVHIGATVIGIK